MKVLQHQGKFWPSGPNPFQWDNHPQIINNNNQAPKWGGGAKSWLDEVPADNQFLIKELNECPKKGSGPLRSCLRRKNLRKTPK